MWGLRDHLQVVNLEKYTEGNITGHEDTPYRWSTENDWGGGQCLCDLMLHLLIHLQRLSIFLWWWRCREQRWWAREMQSVWEKVKGERENECRRTRRRVKDSLLVKLLLALMIHTHTHTHSPHFNTCLFTFTVGAERECGGFLTWSWWKAHSGRCDRLNGFDLKTLIGWTAAPLLVQWSHAVASKH